MALVEIQELDPETIGVVGQFFKVCALEDRLRVLEERGWGNLCVARNLRAQISASNPVGQYIVLAEGNVYQPEG